jgi:hypothetical protein
MALGIGDVPLALEWHRLALGTVAVRIDTSFCGRAITCLTQGLCTAEQSGASRAAERGTTPQASRGPLLEGADALLPWRGDRPA